MPGKSSTLRVLALGGVLALQACTTQMIAQPVPDFSKPAAGQVYYLPRADFQVTVSRELKACAVGYSSDADAAPRWLYEQLNRISPARSAADAARQLAVVLNDPVLQQVDVRSPVKALLANTWLFAVLDAQDSEKAKNASKPASPAKGATKATGKNNAQGLQSIPMTDAQQQEALHALEAKGTEKLPVTFEVEATAQATALVLADTQQAYAIDFNGMQSDLKGTDYSIEAYPNGTLKSINVTIDDQTGPIIQNVLGGLAKIAAGVGGFPLPNIQEGTTALSFKAWKQALSDESNLCNSDVLLKLIQRSALAAKVDGAADAALAAQKKVTKLSEAEVDAQAARDKLDAQIKALPEGDASKAKLQAALKLAEAALKKASKDAADAKDAQASGSDAAAKTAAQFAAVRKALTVTVMTTVSPDPGKGETPLLGPEEAKKAWLDKRFKSQCDPLDAPAACTVTPSAVDEALQASAAFYPMAAGGGPAKPSDHERGVWYRQPLKSNLYVCVKGKCLTDGKPSAPSERTLLASPVDVPQFGPMAFLLLENKTFQNNTISASFAENGALTKLAYKTNAAAAKAAEVFESSADTFMKFKAAKQNQGTAKATAEASELDARKKVIDAQLALEKAQADLDKFRDDQKSQGQ